MGPSASLQWTAPFHRRFGAGGAFRVTFDRSFSVRVKGGGAFLIFFGDWELGLYECLTVRRLAGLPFVSMLGSVTSGFLIYL